MTPVPPPATAHEPTVTVDRAYLRLLEDIASAVDTLVEAGVIVRQTGFMGGGGSVVSYAMNEAWTKTIRWKRLLLAQDRARAQVERETGT